MKNVLFISHRDNYPYDDGGKIASFFGMIALKEKFNIYYAFLTNKIEDDTISKYEKFNIKSIPFEKDLNDNYFDYPKTIFSKLSFKFKKYYSKNFLNRLKEFVKENSIEIIFCSQSQVSNYGLELKKNFPNLKIYLWEHNIEYELVKLYAKASSNVFMKIIAYFEYLKTKRYEISSWNKFDKVFFISDSDCKIAQKYNKNFTNKNVIYTPIKQKTDFESIREEDNSFIFCGSLKSYQNRLNLKYFIDNIWKDFIKKAPSAKLYITGNEEKFLLKRLNLSKIQLEQINIINLGYVEDIERTILEKKYYLSPTYYGSGLRIKVLDGLSLSKLVFVTEIDYNMTHFFKDMENIVLYKNSNDFYNKYVQMENNPDLYNSIKKEGHYLIKYFSLDNYVNNVAKIIE